MKSMTVGVIILFLVPANAWGQGPGTALKFDGVDDYVLVGRPVSENFTIEFWMKTSQTGSTGTQWWEGKGLVDGEVSGVQDDFGISLLGNKVAFGVGNPDVTIISTTIVNDGLWHHIAATRNKSDGIIHLYVDGKLQGTGTGNTNSLTAPSLLCVGNLQTLTPDYYSGLLDEIRIWDVVRDSTEIRGDMHRAYTTLEAGLVAYWRFDEGTGTTAGDLSGNYSGSLTNFNFTESSGWVTSTVPIAVGQTATALSFTSGTANLGSISLVTSDDFDNPVDLYVTLMQSAPNTTAGITGDIISAGQYWTVNAFGTPGSFSASLTFKFSQGSISVPAKVNLYSRTSGSDDVWTQLAYTVSANDSSVTFEGITTFGQFAVSAFSFGSDAGHAIRFDGDATRVEIERPVQDDFTIEFWMKTTQTGSTGTHWWAGMGLVDGEIAGVVDDFGISLLGNTAAFGVGNPDVTIISTLVVNDGLWHHIAATRSKSDGVIRLYVDGTLQGTETGNMNSLASPQSLAFGMLQTGPGNYAGLLDEIRIWDVTRDSTQIRSDMHRVYTAPEPGLVGYWQLNESSGTTAIDLIGSFQGSLTGFEFNETSGWTTSTAPIAAGVSTSIGNFTSGTANLGTVSLTTVDGFDNPVDLVVTRLESDPNTNSGTVGNIVAGAYWVMKIFGDPGTFSANLTFSLSPGSVSSADIAMPSNLKLYRRSSGSDGNWTEVALASSATEATVTFEGVTSLSQFTIGSESSPLPVQLSSFTATAGRLNAELRWRTESETGNYGFDIERRLVHGSQFMVQGHEVMNHEPGTWSRIGFVQGAGTSTSPQDYTFTDKPDQPGRYAYRIKQIDHSGSFTYTSSIEVSIGLAPLEFSLSQNYPNPFNPTTTIEFTIPADGHVILKIYDLTGREVATLVDQEMKAGVYQQVVFDASRLASGLYFAGLQVAGRQLINKLVLMK